MTVKYGEFDPVEVDEGAESAGEWTGSEERWGVGKAELKATFSVTKRRQSLTHPSQIFTNHFLSIY